MTDSTTTATNTLAGVIPLVIVGGIVQRMAETSFSEPHRHRIGPKPHETKMSNHDKWEKFSVLPKHFKK